MAGQGKSGGKRRPNDRGVVAVEFALVLPLLMMVLFGIFTAGLSYTHAIGLTNAVREGARFGATTSATAPTWADDVISRVRATQFDDGTSLADSTTAVCVRLVNVAAPSPTSPIKCSTNSNTPVLTTSTPPALPASITAGCVVEVWAARDFQISLLVFPAWNSTTA